MWWCASTATSRSCGGSSRTAGAPPCPLTFPSSHLSAMHWFDLCTRRSTHTHTHTDGFVDRTLSHMPAGHVVVRYHSNGKELRRQRLYEKALDVCATSPFARFVQRWVLAGVGHGARLAAIVGSRARGNVCGYVFVSYPVAVSGWAGVGGTCVQGLRSRYGLHGSLSQLLYAPAVVAY
jgi:hypothetical protein